MILGDILNNWAMDFILHLRAKNFRHSNSRGLKEVGGFELDESYFGAKQIRGKRGQGAVGKTPIFGLLKHQGKVFVFTVSNRPHALIMPMIQGERLGIHRT